MKMKNIMILFFILCFLCCESSSVPADDYINLVPDQVTVRKIDENDTSRLEEDFGITEFIFITDPDSVFDRSTATSFLTEDKYGSYDVSKALDNSLSTAWVEGAEGPGIGEYIFCVLKPGDFLYIFPGYGSSQKVWALNNRLKKAKVTVYGLKQYTTTGAPEVAFNPMAEEFLLTFQDAFGYQGIPVGRYLFDVNKWFYGSSFLFVAIQILDVYQGTKYDDTCIAEVKTGKRVNPDPADFPM